jgi:hypothetical protein
MFNVRIKSAATRICNIAAVALVAMLVCAGPAHADTYHFAIPTTVIQSALDNAITAAGGTPSLFAFYDFYLRPAVGLPGDVIISPSTLVANYSPSAAIVAGNVVDFASPIPTNVNGDMMTASNYSDPSFDSGRLSARYIYASGASKEPLISDNPNVAGKFYVAGKAAELMPVSFFYININVAGVLNTPLRFEVSANGYLFSNSAASAADAKGQTVKGYLDETGTVPEPGVLFSMGGGLVLIALYGARRRASGRKNS